MTTEQEKRQNSNNVLNLEPSTQSNSQTTNVSHDNLPKAEQIAEDVADVLPKVGSMLGQTLPELGLLLTPIAPEAAVILPIIGKALDTLLSGVSQLIDGIVNTIEQNKNPQNTTDNDVSNSNDDSAAMKPVGSDTTSNSNTNDNSSLSQLLSNVSGMVNEFNNTSSQPSMPNPSTSMSASTA